MNWKAQVDEILQGMKYCFTPVEGKYPELDRKAYEETEEGSLGFLDLVLSLVSDLRKKAYFAGYKKGASDACVDMGKAEHEFDEQLAESGAWRGWGEYDQERE